jgi:SNF2 family DNA or RNA helicase
MRVTKIDDNILSVECTDNALLTVIQNQTDGWKVRGLSQIYLPVKAGPKILNFAQYGLEYNPGAEEAIQTVAFNTQKRIENVQKIRGQYGHEIKFDYDVKGIYKPLEHQKIMFNMIVYNSCAAILADPGTCKTGAYLWAVDKRIQKGQVKKCLVITLNNLKKNIFEEAKVQVPHMKCVILDNKIQSDKILNKSFKGKQNAKKNIDYDIYVSNYESIFSLTDLFDDNYFDMVILDEAHRIGSFRSRQTKSTVSKFENTKYKYIVTGTLNANNALSFFMPYRFLGADTVPYSSFYEFRRKFFYPVDPNQYVWQELSGTRDAAKEIISKIAVFFLKEECLNLPEVITERCKCEMDGEQKQIYEDMRKNLVAVVDDMCGKCDKRGQCDKACDQTISTKNALTLLTKLQQIACGFYMNTTIKVHDDGHEEQIRNTIDFKENTKMKLLIETLGNIPADRKVIIWSTFIHSIDLIAQAIENAGFGKCLKVYEDEDVFDSIAKFRESDIRWFVANQSKAGAGHNIQFSNYQVFHCCNFSYIQRKQAIARQVREGQKNVVTVIDLLCQNTIDEYVYQTLDSKEEMSDDLVSLSKVKKALEFIP